MTHIWVRAEHRINESRVGLTPEGALQLITKGIQVTVEESPSRCIAIERYAEVGAKIAPENSWPLAPKNAFIFGLKELPEDGTLLCHRHIMFGHAYKGQPKGQSLLKRLKLGKGALFDLEYLLTEGGSRVAAFGYWAGFAGAAVALKCWSAQQKNKNTEPLKTYLTSKHLLTELDLDLGKIGNHRPSALIIGALGRVGTGAADLCTAMEIPITQWDLNDTKHGGPFPEILEHELLFNCIVAQSNTPTFVSLNTSQRSRKLTVIGDIACDPDSKFSPIKVYNKTTSWRSPSIRVQNNPPLDVVAIDNLPSILPFEASKDYAGQLLPTLNMLTDITTGVWARAKELFEEAILEN